ncbi:hypothetical protein RVM25_36965, partial [Enterobacter hormaechei subsp. xiangfangensis]
ISVGKFFISRTTDENTTPPVRWRISCLKKSTMVAMTLSPSLAYKLNDRLSIGYAHTSVCSFLSFVCRLVSAQNPSDSESKLKISSLRQNIFGVVRLSLTVH